MRLRRAVLGMAGLVVLSAAMAGCRQTAGESLPSKVPTDLAEPVPGIAHTPPDQIPPNAVGCAASPTGDGQQVLATVSDPAAPRITISVPDGWTSTPGTGDTALTLTGPLGMSATVTIVPTDLPPDAAFARYTAGVGGSMARRKFSVTGAQFCGYSSEQLSGTLQGPSGGIDFAARIAHVRTNTRQYLIAIHLQGPTGLEGPTGFSAASSTLTQDFGVVIP
ncbi:hypothetical protein [Mycobacterium shinjukuense]|uniref:Lipoprotein LpqN n=1 Tax=Mycobacterium shinjukuense TaxID=398694 RepID=A0A7I7MSQ4_9MYCO|nr:hypothetical protein [Mycobacterium shinjukuense]BBX74827.1 hypothetical protein MSHI_27330 [Mycobacterium shinjukuense]